MVENSVILASASSRRHELLARMGVRFVVDVADVDERCEGPALAVVHTVARRKAQAVARRHPGRVVLGSDTVVAIEGQVLGKPRDEADAMRMLRSLAGRWHEVVSGVCVIGLGPERTGIEVTRVHMLPLTDDEIRAYVATGEPMDKAGAYAVQGMGGMFVDRVEGCPHNVMGLPLALTRRMLAE